MAKVYIVNKGNHVYDSAKSFGEIVFLTEGRQSVFSTDNLKEKISSGLDNITDKDYLLVSGHIIPNAIAINCIIKKLSFARILIWIGNKAEYHLVTLT